MKVGFDLDGTLDREEVRALAAALHAAGHEVHVITGFLPGGSYTAEMKVQKLRRLGVRYAKLHLAEGFTMEDIGYAKAKFLEREGIPLMIDDDPTFVAEMQHNSTACILLVV